jgi:rRNA maturation endonuclease Nob1
LRIHLRDDGTPDKAIEFLRDRVYAAKNLQGLVGWSAEEVERSRDAYLAWVEQTESLFFNHTHATDVIEMLYTPGYWQIRQVDVNSARPIPLIEFETRRQIANLERLSDDLGRRRDRALAAAGHIAVLDSGVLLHYQLPDSVDWQAVVGQSEVRLVLPLRVIEELDAKKYTASEKIRGRARELVPKLRAMVDSGGMPRVVRDRTTIEVLAEPGPRLRPDDADTEILQTAHELRQLAGRSVTIVTGDLGMALRAETEGLPVVSMPDVYARSQS